MTTYHHQPIWCSMHYGIHDSLSFTQCTNAWLGDNVADLLHGLGAHCSDVHHHPRMHGLSACHLRPYAGCDVHGSDVQLYGLCQSGPLLNAIPPCPVFSIFCSSSLCIQLQCQLLTHLPCCMKDCLASPFLQELHHAVLEHHFELAGVNGLLAL